MGIMKLYWLQVLVEAIRFNEKTVRPMGRNASGVRGIKIDNNTEEVVGMICVGDHLFYHIGRFKKRLRKTYLFE